MEVDFGGLKQWFQFLRVKRHHSVYLPIGQAKVTKYCARYGAELQRDWSDIPQVSQFIMFPYQMHLKIMAEIAVACGLFNRFHPKFLTMMDESLERACLRRTVECLNLGNCLLESRGVAWPPRVTHHLTPAARWRGWRREPLHEVRTLLEELGFTPPAIQQPERGLMMLAGGPGKVVGAWKVLTVMTESELLRDRMADLLGSLSEYLNRAMGLPKDSQLHVLPMSGRVTFVLPLLLLLPLPLPLPLLFLI